MKNSVFRNIIFVFLISSAGFFLVSCEDFFHSTAEIVNAVNNNNDGDSHPERIFIGGNFMYNSVGGTREAFAPIDGYGHYDYGFFQTENTENGISSNTAGSKSVYDISILEDYIYISGDFDGYDTTLTHTLDTAYQRIVRYNLNGALTSYTPASTLAAGTVYAAEPLPDGSLFAGGDFTNGTDIHGLIKIEPDASFITGNVPSMPSGAEVYSFMINSSDYDALFVGGNFSDYSLDPGFQNGGAQDGVSFIYPGLSITPIASKKIKDIEFSPYGVFICGIDGGSGMLAKYNYSGSFEIDTAFNATFQANSLAGMDINAVKVGNDGFIYIGGSFTGLNSFNSTTHNYLVRLYPSGNIDATFYMNPDGEVHAIEIQENGYIMVGGAFSSVNTFDGSESVNGYFRIKPNGEFDYNFDRYGIPLTNTPVVYSFAFQE